MNKIALPSAENYIVKLYNSIPKHIIFTFIIAIIIGFFTHILYVTNIAPIHDDFYLWNINDFDNVALGRPFMTPIVNLLTGSLYSPFMSFSIGLLLMAVVACFTVAVLNIKYYIGCFLTAGLIAVFPLIAASMMYIVIFQGYMASFFLASAGVYSTIKYKYGFILGAVLFTLSLGIYQSYIAYSIALFALYFIFICLNAENNYKTTLIKIFKSLASVGGGYILYRIVLKLWLYYTNNKLSEYQGIDTSGQIDFVNGLKNAYESFNKFFFKGYPTFSSNAHYIYIILTAIALIMLIMIIAQKRLWKKETLFYFVFLILLIITLPLWIAFIYFMTANGQTHVRDLNIIGYILYPIFIIKLMEFFIKNINGKAFVNNFKSVVSFCIVGLVFILGYRYYITDNQVYTRSLLIHDQVMFYANRLVYDITHTPGWQSDINIVTYGVPGEDLGDNPLKDKKIITGSVPHPQQELTYLPSIINRLIGTPLNFENIRAYKNKETLEEYPIFKEMPVYPEPGSIIIDENGKMLINFGEKEFKFKY